MSMSDYYALWSQFVSNWNTVITSILMGLGTVFLAWGYLAIQVPSMFRKENFHLSELAIVWSGVETFLFGTAIMIVTVVMIYWFRY